MSERDKITEIKFPASAIRICIDRVDDRTIMGRAYSKMEEEAIEFKSLIQLIIFLNNLFDAKGYPQRFDDRRYFDSRKRENIPAVQPQIRMQDREMASQAGQRMTIDMVIQSRLHSGWQGVIKDADGRNIRPFTSDLEFMREFMKRIDIEDRRMIFAG